MCRIWIYEDVGAVIIAQCFMKGMCGSVCVCWDKDRIGWLILVDIVHMDITILPILVGLQRVGVASILVRF